MPPALITAAASSGVLNPPAIGARTIEELSFGKGTIVFQFTNEKVTRLNAST
jgi:hypothetical protein